MKNTKKPELNREENYLVKATLIVNGTEIKDVPCKIYLPERNHEKPYLIFKPSEEVADKITCSHKCSLKAAIYGFDKQIQTSIEAPEVYLVDSISKQWADDISETTIHAEPQNLHVIDHYANPDDQEKTRIVFWISPNEFLTPFMMRSSSYTGEIKYDRVGNIEFTVKDGFKLVFEKHFSSKTAKNKDLVQWSFLVACAELNDPAHDVERLKSNTLKDIDDFLLIASFAARKRTVCLGWTATDKNSHATYYRGNYTFPESRDDGSLYDGLVDNQDFEEFIKNCYPIFLNYNNKLALRNALFSAVPFEPLTIETSFLHMFSGLETLILDFKRRENLEFVLPEDKWLDLKKYLQDCIRESNEPKLEHQERASIYRKLDELNRISLSESFEVFCQKYAIDLTDLWPVFDNKGIIGLADIRNKLIHGDPLPHELYGPLIVAKECLKYTLERVLVKVLSWDIGKTKVDPAYLAKHLVKYLRSEQARLTEYITTVNVRDVRS